MWPDSIEVLNVGGKYAVELLLMQDEQVVETLSSHTSKKPFTDGIRSRGVKRSFKNLNVTRLRNSREAHPKLAIMITDQILRSLSIGGGFPNRYVRSKRRWDIVVMCGRRGGSLSEIAVRQ